MPLTNVGGSSNVGGMRLARAIEMAVNEINNDGTILPNTTLTLILMNHAQSGSIGAERVVELIDAHVAGSTRARCSTPADARAARSALLRNR